MANWIWLPNCSFPEHQLTHFPSMGVSELPDVSFCLAEFQRTYVFSSEIERVEFCISADVFYYLTVNGEWVGKGPASAGGDFLCDRTDALPQYSDQYTLSCDADTLDFYVQVRLSRERLPEYSKGHGGLMVEGIAYLKDGSMQPFSTDAEWLCRVDRRRPTVCQCDMRIQPEDWKKAEPIPDLWNAECAALDPLAEEKVFPKNAEILRVPAGETQTFTVEFERIYAAFVGADISGNVEITVEVGELPGRKTAVEQIRSSAPFSFRSLLFYSVGAYTIHVRNLGDCEATVFPYAIFTHYPVYQEGTFRCSDSELNAVYDVCKWTLRICRQSLHLDSSLHQELLACTGDYYIEALMTAFTFGDMTLAKMDLIRTANWLTANQGVMFHTTYSLIWVQMLLDVYRFDGDPSLLQRCLPALRILLERFKSYLGENNVVEYAPNYMFVDWTTLDGYSLHHPPKYLGQAVLTAFFYGALQNAVAIYSVLQLTDEARETSELAAQVGEGFNRSFYDAEQGLYFEGLDTPDRVRTDRDWLPENPNGKRYYAAYSNILAALYGICDTPTAKRILRAFAAGRFDDIQPYFMHFALEAIDRVGLYAELGRPILERWKPLTQECRKGLKEGWLRMEGYPFDYSHAWGGTPAYQLPARMLGFRMEEPGFRAISLCPTLFDLDYAEITMPTPFGFIECRMEKGHEPQIQVPEEIRWSLRSC